LRGAKGPNVLRKDAKIVLASALACALACVSSPGPAAAAGAIVIDTTDGHVLYAEEVDTPWYPASLTKMMTAYVAFQAIRDHRITLDTKIFISPHAHAQPPTRLGLKAGKDLPLGDALRALIMRSANDLAIAIAETIGGDEASFVKTMNQTAAQLGMLHTHFINPNGLPAKQQMTTPRDMALLAQALVHDFPEYAAMFSDTHAIIAKVEISTHNALLGSFQGADGMKTGYTCASGYNLVASATRDGHRLVAVTLGDESSGARNARAAALLEHGFKTLEWKALVPTARVENFPSGVVGAAFEPDGTMLEHWKGCQDLPPPPEAAASAGKDGKDAKKQQASLTETKKPVRQVRSSGSRKRRHVRNE
jgi:D-alanyl-D-alanine carboxypeptidase